MESLINKLIEDENFEKLMQLIRSCDSTASCIGGGASGGAGDCGSCQVS